MQKFILTFLFLGLLASLFYMPVPMEKIETALERGEILQFQKAQPTIQPNSVEKVASDFNQVLFLEIENSDTKKNKKNSGALSSMQILP